jgi:hypothetical protein
MSYHGATPRDDISTLPEGDHLWFISILGDAPVFLHGFPTVVAPSAFAARAKAEMLPVIRSAGIDRERLLLTRMTR